MIRSWVYCNRCSRRLFLLRLRFFQFHLAGRTYTATEAWKKENKSNRFCEICGTKTILKDNSGFTRDYNNINKIMITKVIKNLKIKLLFINSK